MKPLIHFFSRGTRNQSIGLLAIGLGMFACSNLAERAVSSGNLREASQLLIILAGITLTAILFRPRNSGTHRR